MSCPLIVNRKWTKAEYLAIRKLTRYLWWRERVEEKLLRATCDAALYGIGYIKLEGE